MTALRDPDVALVDVPADMVMASGSGLDPHITLKNALYPLDRVADAWAQQTNRDPDALRTEITDMLHQKAFAPLGGLVGNPRASNARAVSLDGTAVSLEAMHGGVVLVNVWSVWCLPCRVGSPSSAACSAGMPRPVSGSSA